MKKIITTVGTSILTNYQKSDVQTKYIKPAHGINYEEIDIEYIDNNSTSAKDREDLERRCENIIDTIKERWLKGIQKQSGTWTNWDKESSKANIEASAEIKSIITIVDTKTESDTEVYLLATDTVLSVVACELIAAFFTPKNEPYVTEKGHKVYIKNIKKEQKENTENLVLSDGGLMVVDGLAVSGVNASANFKNIGFSNLVDNIILFTQDKFQIDYILAKLSNNDKDFRKSLLKINENEIVPNFRQNLSTNKIWSIDCTQLPAEIGKKYEKGLWTDFIKKSTFFNTISNNNLYLNISGGYKALIPILTILGQLYRVPLFYIYEDSNELIEINQLPISFDWILAQEYMFFLNKQKLSEVSFRQKNDKQIQKLIQKGLISSEDNSQCTIVGEIFYKYAETYSTTANSVLGKFYEHMLYVYYTQSKQYLDVKISFNIPISEKTTREIDIILYDKNDKNIHIIEAKSFGEAKKYEERQSQYLGQINAWKALANNDLNSKYSLLTYKVSIWSIGEVEHEIEELKEEYAKIKVNIQEQHPDIIFLVDYVKLSINFGEESIQKENTLQQLFKNPIKTDDINPLIQ
jgi:CRISPR/Cas system-associated protein Csm6